MARKAKFSFSGQNLQIDEIELDCSLNILAALEAMLRVDFIIRCEKKLKDVASLHFQLPGSAYILGPSLPANIKVLPL